MGGLLDYRGHEPADVPPVLIERGDGRVRIVVQYPPAARRRARNRWLISSGLAIALVMTMRMAIGAPHLWIKVVGSFWFIGVIAAIVMTLLWVQAQRTWVVEVDRRQLCIESRGVLRTRRRCWGREWVGDVELASNLRGRAVALVIRGVSVGQQWRYFEYLDERYLHEIAGALREGLAETFGS